MAFDLEPELDKLFAAPLGEFVAVRDDLAKRLRANGDADAADRVKELRKPSLAVWAVNQLSRAEAKGLGALLKAGADLRKAQEEVLAGESPSRLQPAVAAERDEVERLTAKARGLLEEAGHPVTDTTLKRVGATLHAVATKPELGELAERGPLEHEEETTGFGFESLGALRARPRAAASGRKDRARKESARARVKEAEAELAEARKEARRASSEVQRLTRELERATAAAERAEEAVRRRERAVEQARANLD
jgi:hypothetical protein